MAQRTGGRAGSPARGRRTPGRGTRTGYSGSGGPGRPGRPRRPAPTPDELAEAGLPRWLAPLLRLPRSAQFLLTLAVVLAAIFSPPPISGVLLLALALALVGLMVRTWPVQPASTRALRLVVLVILVVSAVSRLH